jgi:S-(hydroxymethyl)glutathione dehydrogenase/alcohol dehydrogenase
MTVAGMPLLALAGCQLFDEPEHKPMRAAVLPQIPSMLEVTEIQIDRPGPREVLVRTVAAGLCHSDLHFMEGKYSHDTPTVPGHEAAGIVEAVGSDVTHVQPGDHVIGCLSIFCGHCEYCLSGRPVLCDRQGLERADDQLPRLSRDGAPIHQFLRLSAFAEMMLVHENTLVKIREEMPLDRAALIGCAVTTGLGAVFNTAKVPPGSTVAVIGCGGVGLNSVQGAVIAGAGRVIAVDTNPWKLELARTFGATDLVDATAGDPVAQVRELTGGGVEFSFEAIGLKTTAEQSFAMLRKGGTATIIGMIPEGQRIELPGSEFLDEKKIQGSNMGSNRFRVDMPRYVDLYLNGRLKLDELVSARIDLDQINDGFDAMRRGEVARSVIAFG